VKERGSRCHRGARVAGDLKAWDEFTWRDEPEPDAMRQGRVVHLPRERDQAMWTPSGGAAFCGDPAAATVIAEIAADQASADGLSLVTALEARLGEVLGPVSCRLDIGMYGYGLPPGLDHTRLQEVETVDPRSEGLPEFPAKVEHAFVVRRGGEIVAWATNIPHLRVDDHRLHSIGVETHPEHRRRGLGKAVAGALLDHLAADGDAVMWVYEAHNAPSLGLARALGFFEHLWVLNWKHAEASAGVHSGGGSA